MIISGVSTSMLCHPSSLRRRVVYKNQIPPHRIDGNIARTGRAIKRNQRPVRGDAWESAPTFLALSPCTTGRTTGGVKAPTCALIQIKVERYFLVSEFQKVVEVDFQKW